MSIFVKKMFSKTLPCTLLVVKIFFYEVQKILSNVLMIGMQIYRVSAYLLPEMRFPYYNLTQPNI